MGIVLELCGPKARHERLFIFGGCRRCEFLGGQGLDFHRSEGAWCVTFVENRLELFDLVSDFIEQAKDLRSLGICELFCFCAPRLLCHSV